MLVRSQGVVCLFVVCFLVLPAKLNADDPPTEITETPEWQSRIETALATKGDWDFFDAPLTEVCSFFQSELGIDVVLDRKALEDFGIDPESPITRAIRGIKCESFLRHALREFELSYTIREGALWITTPEEVDSRLVTRVYPVGDLLHRRDLIDEETTAYDQLTWLVASVIEPDTWDEVGGPGSIEGIYDALVIAQTQDIHRQISELLETYRAIIANAEANAVAQQTAYYLGQNKTNATILKALATPFTGEFKDAALRDVVGKLTDKMEIPIIVDTRALEDLGIDASTPISGTFSNTPLAYALRRLLHQQELTYVIRDEVVVITTSEECESQLTTGLYPIRDLVSSTENEIVGFDETVHDDFDALMQVISETVSPDTWDQVGGPGAMEVLLKSPVLVVSQTQDVHREVAALVETLRVARKHEGEQQNQDEPDPGEFAIRVYPLVLTLLWSSEDVQKLVIRSLERDLWDEADGTFVQALGSSLVVKHNASVHRRVRRLLTELGVVQTLKGHACFGCSIGFGGGGVQSGNGPATNATNGATTAPASKGPSPGGFF